MASWKRSILPPAKEVELRREGVLLLGTDRSMRAVRGRRYRAPNWNESVWEEY